MCVAPGVRTPKGKTHTWGPTSRPVSSGPATARPPWSTSAGTASTCDTPSGRHRLLRRGGDAGWIDGAARRFEREETTPSGTNACSRFNTNGFVSELGSATAVACPAGVSIVSSCWGRLDARLLVASEHVVDPADHQNLRRRDVLRLREAGDQLLRDWISGFPPRIESTWEPPTNVTPMNRSGRASSSASLPTPNWFQKYFGAASCRSGYHPAPSRATKPSSRPADTIEHDHPGKLSMVP